MSAFSALKVSWWAAVTKSASTRSLSASAAPAASSHRTVPSRTASASGVAGTSPVTMAMVVGVVGEPSLLKGRLFSVGGHD